MSQERYAFLHSAALSVSTTLPETMEVIPILVGLGTPLCAFSPFGTVGIIAAINAAKKPLIPYYDDGAALWRLTFENRESIHLGLHGDILCQKRFMYSASFLNIMKERFKFMHRESVIQDS